MKRCTQCKIEKDLSEFFKRTKSKSGYKSECKTCTKLKRKNVKTDPERNRIGRLRYYYGITPEDYNNLFNLQDGKCAICEKHQSEFKKRLSVDHCHETSKIRGLLCDNCNHALGKFKDKETRLLKAVEYLRRYKD